MNTATSIGWRDTYLRIAERLVAKAGTARPILTGANACVDAIFHIDADRLARLAAPSAIPPAAPSAAPSAEPLAAPSAEPSAAPSADDERGIELCDRVLKRITAGRGGELLTRWPAGPSWIYALLGPPDRQQVGGTGPQASWALAMVGARSVLALADRSAEQLAVIDPRTGVCADGTVVAAGSLTPSGRATKLPHCILEFTAGTTGRQLAVPRSSRIILRFGDEPIERDEAFFAMAPALASSAGAGLLSGLNVLADADTADRDWLAALARAWSDAGLAVIHHELAEFLTAKRLREAVGSPAATSLGLSLSELFMLTGAGGDPRLLARDVAERYGARRVIVHADDWALAVHRDDAQHQEDVVLAGNAFAAARARVGQPATVLDPAEEATYTDDLPPRGALGDGWHAVCVPAPHLRRPAGTVGLGDTFVAGVLLAESLP
jgi:hypothetical protein